MQKNTEKKENLFLNLILNIILPTFVLIKLSGDEYLGNKLGIVVALSFPIGYGIYDFFRVKKINLFSALGVVSVLLTGGISLMELDPKYIAIKEATIPGIIGLVTLFSVKTKYPLVKVLLYNDKFMHVDRISTELARRNNEKTFRKVMFNASVFVASSFFLSSFLNYALAKYIVVSAPGTEAFNAELGKMTALSFPVITIPSLIVLFGSLYYLIRRIGHLTELPFEQIFNIPEEEGENDNNATEKEKV